MTDDDEFTDDEITGPIEVKRHGPDKPRTVYTIHPNARPFGIPAPRPRDRSPDGPGAHAVPQARRRQMMVMDDRTMSLTYVIPDLHGRCDLLERALKAIEERHQPIEAVTVVFLGDYIDRGFESQQVLHTLMNGPPKSHWNWIVLRGNHEDIMLQAMGDIRKLQWWLGNGGGMTLESFGVVWAQVGDYVTADTRAIPEDVLDWLDDLPLAYHDKHRTFVHAGGDPDRPLDRQGFDKDGYEIMLWKYYRPNDHRGHGDSHVVHGHHSHHQGPLLLSGRTNLDTGAWQTGRLVIGVFDDDIAGGPIDTIEIVGPKYGELPEFAAMQAEKDDAQEREKRMTPHLAAPTRDSQFWGRGGRAILLSAWGGSIGALHSGLLMMTGGRRAL